MLKKTLKWIWEILEVLIIVYVIFVTCCILFRNDYGFTQFGKYVFVTVNDDNQKLVPNNDVGDLLIIKHQKFNINEGDLIYYYVTINEEYVVRSGVVESKTEDTTSALYVLNDEDKTSVSSNRVVGKYVSVHPGKGSVLEVLESRAGFLFLVLLPILIVFIYQVYQLVIVAKYEEVEEDDFQETDKIDSKKSKSYDDLI